jgi:4-amino-4-deoxy-L-arabinose transferase-like glycosyltransferase
MHAAGVLLMLAIALPWPIYVWRHVPHAIELWRYESVGEMSDNTENARPWHFYLPQLFFLALPWTAVGVVGIARQGVRAFHRYNAWVRRRVLEDERRRVQGLQVSNSKSAMGPPLAASQQTSASNVADPLQLLSTADKSTSQIPRATDAAKPQAAPSPAARPRLDYRSFFPLFWYFAMVVFFSFVHLKKNQYLLPVLPAQALLIAQGLAVLLTALRKPAIKRPALALIILQTLLAIGFAVAIAVMAHKPGHWSGADFAAAIIALAAAVFPVSALYAKRFRIWALVQAGVYIMLFLAFGRLCFAPREAERSAKPVAAEVAQLLRQPGWTLLTTQLPEEVAVYLPAGVHYDFRSGHVLVVLDDQHEVARRQIQPGEIPTPNLGRWIPDGKITEIKRVPLQAAPGDSRWKVWELTVDRKLFAWAGQESSGQE